MNAIEYDIVSKLNNFFPLRFLFYLFIILSYLNQIYFLFLKYYVSIKKNFVIYSQISIILSYIHKLKIFLYPFQNDQCRSNLHCICIKIYHKSVLFIFNIIEYFESIIIRESIIISSNSKIINICVYLKQILTYFLFFFKYIILCKMCQMYI